MPPRQYGQDAPPDRDGVVLYAYVCEAFIAWYGNDTFEIYTNLVARTTGPYAPVYFLVLFCNCLVPQLLWSGRVRTTPDSPSGASRSSIQVGMWSRRYMLIVSSENRDFLPSSWHLYRPSAVDVSILVGTISFFLFLFLLFLRAIPFIPISELKATKREVSRA